MDVHLAGDAQATLGALIPLLRPRSDDAWRERIADWKESWEHTLRERAELPADPVNPQLVAFALSRRLPERTIVAADSGSSTVWYAQQIKLRAGMRASLSGTLASMGSAVPYAIAAKLAYPDRPVLAIAGDGAIQMNGLNELITLVKYRERWREPTFVVCVFNNRDLNMVTWEQRVLAGDPKYPASQTIPDLPYARLAELIGLRGIRVDRPEDVGDAVDEAFSAGEPTLLEAVVDPEIPPLPPHLTFDQASNLARALLKGDPEGPGILRKSIAAKLADLVRH
jgi:pyruvate dehydrogenase (quinone)